MLTVNTYLDKSKVHGIGCFTDQFIKKGTVIWRLVPTFDVIITDSEFKDLPSMAKKHIKHFAYYSRIDGGWVLCSDNSKYFNHSRSPNCLDIGIYTTAKRDIKAGEELTCDYYSFDEKTETKLK